MKTIGSSFALLAVLLVGVLTGLPAHAVANGEAVPDGKYPFAVKITELGIPTPEGGTRDSSCSGGLISPHWIITAAHCFKDVDGNRVSKIIAAEVTATVGRASLTGRGGTVANVVQVKQHGEADVALARLDKAVTGVTPLRLNRAAPQDGQKARLVGWGFTSRNAEQTPNRARTGRFEVTSVAATEMGLSGVAPKSNTSPCERDSGGPYFVEAKDGTATLIGVVSRGPDCPHTGPDTATRVDVIAPWIKSVIKDDVVAAPSPSKTTVKPATRNSTKPPAAAAPEPASATPFTPVLLAAIPAAAVGFVAVLLAGARKSRRRRRYRSRR